MNRSLMAEEKRIIKLFRPGEMSKETFLNARPHYDIPWFDQMIDFPSWGKGGGRRLSILFG